MLLSKRLIGLELSMPLRNLSSQVVAKIGQVLVRMLSHRGVLERLCGLLDSLVPDGLLECSHLYQGLIFRDCLSSCNLGFGLRFAQLVLQRPIISMEPGELPLEQLDLSLGPLEPFILGH